MIRELLVSYNGYNIYLLFVLVIINNKYLIFIVLNKLITDIVENALTVPVSTFTSISCIGCF